MADPLIAAVKAHALKRYNDGGWDYIVECWDDEQIAEAIKGATTEIEAIAKVAEVADLLGERRQDVTNEIF